jgi:membrane protease YdiL (CAAX protease family)
VYGCGKAGIASRGSFLVVLAARFSQVAAGLGYAEAHMTDSSNEPPATDGEPRVTSPESRPLAARAVALLEVVLCSDYPTQFALAATLNAAGYSPIVNGQLSLRYIVMLSLVDSVLLIGLIVLFLRSHGERVRDVLLGPHPVAGEVLLGVQLTFGALVFGIAVLTAVQALFPRLHNVVHNPLQDLIRGPRNAGIFAIVVVVAGGVREEIQRAFVLHRFKVWLGGGTVGIIVGSIAFGAGHLVQGYDAAIATGLLGVFWGIMYLRRGSVVAPIVSHSGFNLIELLQYLAFAGR